MLDYVIYLLKQYILTGDKVAADFLTGICNMLTAFYSINSIAF